MPHTYIRKSNKNRSYSCCDVKDLSRAAEVVENVMSIRKAAMGYGMM